MKFMAPSPWRLPPHRWQLRKVLRNSPPPFVARVYKSRLPRTPHEPLMFGNRLKYFEIAAQATLR